MPPQQSYPNMGLSIGVLNLVVCWCPKYKELPLALVGLES